MSLYIPKVLIKRHKDPKWYDSDIRHNLKCLRTLKRKDKKSQPSPMRGNKINDLQHYVQSKLLHAKTNFENNLLESCTSSSVFSYIRSVSNSCTMPPTLHLDSDSASSDYEKATLFNRYFHSVFTSSSFQSPPLIPPTVSKTFFEVVLSDHDVFCALRSLDPSKAMGCDKISPKLLKHCALALYLPIHHLFFLSLSQGYLPMEWRTHLVKPIFKSGDITSVKNYRPISLLPIVSKVLEKIVYNNIVNFITSSISPHQFGFLRNRSTLQQLLVFFDTMFSSPKLQIDVVYLDFCKAFDSVAHSELLLKLWKFGITGNIWSWLRAYLTERIQYVSVGQSLSDSLPVISGVPQGSILGPILFLIFINDLPTIFSSCKVLLFADDAKCLMPISSKQDCMQLQFDLDRLSEWCHTWSLALNEEKCLVIHFTKSHSSEFLNNYSLNGKEISHAHTGKDLGLIVSSNFQWRLHYAKITSSAYKFLGLLRRIFSAAVSTRAKLTLYISLVRSRLLYGSVVWRPHLLVDIKSLELVQRRASKFIVSPNLDYRQRLIELHLLPLMMEFEIADVLFFVKSLKFPSHHFNVQDFVEFCYAPTRSSTNYKLRHSLRKSNVQSNHYFNRIPRLWNSLPPLDLNLSISSIKLRIREIFWAKFISNFDPENPCSYHYLCPCYKCCRIPVPMHFTNNQ